MLTANNTERKFNTAKFASLTENGDKRVRIAGGDRRISTVQRPILYLLEARLFQINRTTGFARYRCVRFNRVSVFENKKMNQTNAPKRKNGIRWVKWERGKIKFVS